MTQTRIRRLLPLLCSEYSAKPDGTPPLIVAPESIAKRSPPLGFGLGLGEEFGLGETVGFGEAVGLGLPVGVGLAVGEGEAVGLLVGDGDGEPFGEPVGDGVAVPVGEAVGDGEPVVTPKTPERIAVPLFETVTGIPFEIVGTFCPFSVRMSIEALRKPLTVI